MGDADVILKYALPVSSATAFGAQLGVKAPTARDGIGTGKRDYLLTAIYSHDVNSRVHLDLHLGATRLGAYAADRRRIQSNGAAAFTLAVAEKWSVCAELSGVRQQGAAGTAQCLLAGSYSPTKGLVIDFGVARG